MENFSKTRYFSITILFVCAFFVLGIYVGNHNRSETEKVIGVLDMDSQVTSQTDFSPFWKTWNIMDEKHPEASKTSNQDRVYGAISGLVSSLDDPYTIFFNPEETKLFEEEIAGNFDGIGIEVGMKDKILTVVAPLKDTPAFRADIRSGDRILKIDDTVTTGLTIDSAIKLMRGSKGTPVILTIYREGIEQPKEIEIIRDTINFPTLDTEVRKDGIFVIKLYSFSANSAGLFRNAIKEFYNSGKNKLLLDLRGNPGGYLEAAVDMASWFLKGGKVVVTEDYGDNRESEIFRSKGYDLFDNKLSMIILIDGGSASASEILAGALQDNGIAKLVGTQSFGKGSIQEVVNITSDTVLKITVAKWLTPNGTSISEKGLTPDYLVENTEKDMENKTDSQMNKAIELLLE